MKRKVSDLNEQERIETLDALYTAASSVKGRDAVKLFLRDLLTESERIMLGRRILIARMLIGGSSYAQIGERMHVGYDTIERIQKWLSDTAPGYERVVAEMEEEFKKRNKKKLWKDLYSDPSLSGLLARLKKQRPLEFLLFPMPKKYRDL